MRNISVIPNDPVQAPEDKVKVKLEPGTAADVKAEGGGENGVPTPADARRKPPPTRRKRFYDSESTSGEDEEDSEKSDDEVFSLPENYFLESQSTIIFNNLYLSVLIAILLNIINASCSL